MRYRLSRGKRPNEKIRIGIDFENDLEAGDSISSHVVTAYDAEEVDVSDTVLTSKVISGTESTAVCQAGTSGVEYRVVFKATSANGLVYEHDILVPVSESA